MQQSCLSSCPSLCLSRTKKLHKYLSGESTWPDIRASSSFPLSYFNFNWERRCQPALPIPDPCSSKHHSVWEIINALVMKLSTWGDLLTLAGDYLPLRQRLHPSPPQCHMPLSVTPHEQKHCFLFWKAHTLPSVSSFRGRYHIIQALKFHGYSFLKDFLFLVVYQQEKCLPF